MNNQTQFATGIFLALAGLLTLSTSVYVLDETQQAFITRFGKIVGDPVTEPGLKFKMPVVDKIHHFDRRYLEWDGVKNQVPTLEKTFIEIDTYARWRIQDPKTFFEKVKNEAGARDRIRDSINGAAKSTIAKHNLVEAVRSEDREAATAPETQEEGELLRTESSVLKEFKIGRQAISRMIHQVASKELVEFGIELLDFRFKRINYSPDVQKTIFNGMIAERKQMAEKFRSEGYGKAAEIEGQKQLKLDTIQSQAAQQVKEIHGRADAEAIQIYAEAFNQSEEAREFYAFLKTLEAYKESISNKDNLIFTTDSEFYRYLRQSQDLAKPKTTE